MNTSGMRKGWDTRMFWHLNIWNFDILTNLIEIELTIAFPKMSIVFKCIEQINISLLDPQPAVGALMICEVCVVLC